VGNAHVRAENIKNVIKQDNSSEIKDKLKTAWTWKEWQASRAAAKRIGPTITRRNASSSDRRLHAAFAGQRGPAFYGK